LLASTTDLARIQGRRISEEDYRWLEEELVSACAVAWDLEAVRWRRGPGE
jgi:hypothetical protein